MVPKTLTASIRRTRLWFVPKMELDEFNSRRHANIKLQLAIARPVTFRRRYSRPIGPAPTLTSMPPSSRPRRRSGPTGALSDLADSATTPGIVTAGRGLILR
jgi:hypothetical protein